MKYSTKTLVIGAALAGLLGGTSARAGDHTKDKVKSHAKQGESADHKSEKHSCHGKNACKGKGGCKSGDNGCAGKNSCKGKGGCAAAMGEEMKSHKDEKAKDEKHACSGKSGCASK